MTTILLSFLTAWFVVKAKPLAKREERSRPDLMSPFGSNLPMTVHGARQKGLGQTTKVLYVQTLISMQAFSLPCMPSSHSLDNV